MTLSKVLKKRGATVTVTAYGEALFTEGQVVDRWTRRFSRRISRFAAEAAPAHGQGGKWPGERTLRPHDRGLPLKKSFTSTTEARPAHMRVDAAVGNTAPYSLFVDQGTGVFNPEGGTPYAAKVLPPWREGEGSLYEAAWHPGKRQVAPVMIQGQQGQNFMEKGLKRAFESMMRRAYQVADPRVGRAMAFFPERIALRGTGNTPNDAAFRASMEEWRRWRDEAFRRGDQLGRGQRAGRTRKGYVEARDAYRKAQRDLATSRAYADQRDREMRDRLAEEQRRKQEGEERREREARVIRERNARAAAVRWSKQQRKIGTVITGGAWVQDAEGRYSAFKVTYVVTNSKGKAQTKTRMFQV